MSFAGSNWICIVCVVSLVISTSCARNVRIPTSSIEDVDLSAGVAWRIETVDGRAYVSDRVKRSNSSLVIEAVLDGGKRTFVDPIEVPFDQIKELERMEISPWRTTTLIVTTGIVVVGIVAAVLFARTMGGLGGLR